MGIIQELKMKQTFNKYTHLLGRNLLVEQAEKQILTVLKAHQMYIFLIPHRVIMILIPQSSSLIIRGLFMPDIFQLHLNYLNCLILKQDAVMNIQKQRPIIQIPVLI